ncbi:MAG: sodium-dependent transporter [Lachnospiraceae bacterium]|nr:sodium-dependent transporter [Lachnospiraceae bacterium]
MEQKRGFASRIGFIFSMAAFSIGIGNLWKFPYMVGNNGGGAFLLVYLILVLLVGIPAFIIEVTLGRSSGLSPVLGMRKLEGGKKTPWSIIGWLGVIAIFIIVSYATMIVGGWTGGYIYKIMTGSLNGLSADEIAQTFGSFAGDPFSLVFAAAEALLLWFCLCSGVKKGVEKVCSILLPMLLVIMIGLSIYSNTLSGAWQGLKWYLTPDFSKISLSSIAAASCQVFFSIGVGMCGAFVYGSYSMKEGNLPKSMFITGIMDTCIAILAGILVVPALFAFDIEPTSGPSLIFITLPHLFNSMGSIGTVFGVLYMTCVFFAGFTSIIGGSEALVAVICDGNPKVDRKKAATIVVLAQFLFGVVFTLSFGTGTLSQIKILGLSLFDFADFIASLCMCLGSVVMLAYVIFRWGFQRFKEEANVGASGIVRIYNWMKVYICYIYPVVLIAVFYSIMRMYF